MIIKQQTLLGFSLSDEEQKLINNINSYIRTRKSQRDKKLENEI